MSDHTWTCQCGFPGNPTTSPWCVACGTALATDIWQLVTYTPNVATPPDAQRAQELIRDYFENGPRPQGDT